MAPDATTSRATRRQRHERQAEDGRMRKFRMLHDLPPPRIAPRVAHSREFYRRQGWTQEVFHGRE